MFTQYLFKSNRPDIPFAKYDDPIVEAAIEQRRKFFEAKRDHLYRVEIFYCILLEGARSVRAGPAGKRSKAPCRRNLLPSSNKRSSLPRESANGLITPVSLPTLCTPVLPSNSNSSPNRKAR